MSPFRARVSRLLSTPKRASPSGLPAVRSALVTTSPASPALRILSLNPLSCSKAFFTAGEIANESWVRSTTSFGAPPPPQPAETSARAAATAASSGRGFTSHPSDRFGPDHEQHPALERDPRA